MTVPAYTIAAAGVKPAQLRMSLRSKITSIETRHKRATSTHFYTAHATARKHLKFSTPEYVASSDSSSVSEEET